MKVIKQKSISWKVNSAKSAFEACAGAGDEHKRNGAAATLLQATDNK